MSNLPALGIGNAHTQSLQCSQAPITGTGVTATNQDGVDVMLQRGMDQFSHTPGRGEGRVTHVSRHQAQAGCSSHFHHGHPLCLAAEQGEM